MEARIDDDHQLNNDTYVVRNVVNGAIVSKEEVPALTAINMRLRDDYVRDASGGVGRWNKLLQKGGNRLSIHPASWIVSSSNWRLFCDQSFARG